MPNAETYPFQWLWDSCFHCLIWNHLGSERAQIELNSVFVHQSESGFVPHMTYWGKPDFGQTFWGRSQTSTITQPPMYGHVIAELERTGTQVDEQIYRQASRGLLHLLTDRKRTAAGLVPIFHPWESGCDDSARWDSWRQFDDVQPASQQVSGPASSSADENGTASIEAWRRRKGELVRSLEVDPDGGPTSNSQFSVGSVGFNALVAWNSDELLAAAQSRMRSFDPDVVTQLTELEARNAELKIALRHRWDPELVTWCDDGPVSGRTRTADALLPLLVDPRLDAFDSLVDSKAFAGPFGIRGAHQAEPSYDPATYWRGPSWPQIIYLLHQAARPHSAQLASTISERFLAGAVEAELAEYWHPETGQALGAIPQTWTGLALLVESELRNE